MSTYVLVHGAWHGSWCWEKLVPPLEARGHRVVTFDLPGHGSDLAPARDVTLQSYADRICQTLSTLDEPAILVGHSMGGVAISQAAENCPERIGVLVYLAAFLLCDGESVFQVGTADPDSLLVPNLLPDEQAGVLRIREGTARAIFYHDCPEADAVRAVSLLRPDPIAPVATPLKTTEERFGRVPRVYVETRQDRAISPGLQKRMYSAQPCQQVISLDTSHSPFYSAPEELATHLLEIAPDGAGTSGIEI